MVWLEWFLQLASSSQKGQSLTPSHVPPVHVLSEHRNSALKQVEPAKETVHHIYFAIPTIFPMGKKQPILNSYIYYWAILNVRILKIFGKF